MKRTSQTAIEKEREIFNRLIIEVLKRISDDQTEEIELLPEEKRSMNSLFQDELKNGFVPYPGVEEEDQV